MTAESRVYFGKIPLNIAEGDLRKHLSIFGPITELTLRTGYAIANFEFEKDAMDAISALGKRRFMGAELRVSLYVPRVKIQPVKHIPERAPRSRIPKRVSREYSTAVDSKNTVVFTYLNKEICWQQLKDFGRSAGRIAYCETSKKNRRVGFIKYETKAGAEKAIQILDGKELLNCHVRAISLAEYDRTCDAEALRASRMRSRSTGVENSSSIADMEQETFNPSRNKRRRIDDDRGRSPVRRNGPGSGHALVAIGQAPVFGKGSTGAVEPGEPSEDVKTEGISADSPFEALFRLTAGITRPSLPSAGQV
ncbi:hypothetical protein FOMPIDRAFT_89429 [Fomitopsis schrenkii]|uniref:RRM domain-containing protein n=1 Tax=Fomitopsis schrenkii TaxID=2126942 RepID=S8EDZ3_FOMSC|nr:hypothetical protein FOMPIDRAFT_89429 [Fomitopsis schrenkii]